MIGVGVDTIAIARIERALAKHGNRFSNRILGPGEGDGSPEVSARELAKAFAAKEAVAKALGTGFRGGVSWRDIIVGRDPLGKPTVQLNGVAAAVLAGVGGSRIHLSIADDEVSAIAFAVAV